MKNVASADQELTVEERNLLSVAYKNVIGARRASWRIVTSIEQKEESKGNESQVHLIKEYRQKIEAELGKICEDILEVLDKHLIASAQTGESKVFYHKMCAGAWSFLFAKGSALTDTLQEGRLSPIPRRVCHDGQAQGIRRQVSRGLQSSYRHRPNRSRTNASYSPRSRSQLLGILLRDPEFPGSSMSPREASL